MSKHISKADASETVNKWQHDYQENGYILSELVYVLAILTFFGLMLWVVIHFIAKFW